MDVPSMVRRSGDQLIVRQVVSGQQEVLGGCIKVEVKIEPPQQPFPFDDVGQVPTIGGPGEGGTDCGSVRDRSLQQTASSWKRTDHQLPQCKVKRNYSCPSCAYGTQNPRRYLTHLRDTHGEKVSINACQRCLYASRHHQKLVRHMRMVHGTVEAGSRRSVESDEALSDRSKCTVATDGDKQQLVASDFQALLKRIENTWNSSIAAANFELLRNALQIEMDSLRSVVHSPKEIIQSDNVQLNSTRRSMDDTELTPRKRSRPIPNLIPLAAPPTVAVRPEKELLKPVPMSMLMPPEGSSTVSDNGPNAIRPPNGSSPQSLVCKTHMKCTFCELSYGTTVDLANHIEAAHKEDLFTSLLQRPIDDAQQNLFPQSETDCASNERWKGLLEVNGGGSGSEKSAKILRDQDGRPPTQPVEDDDVEILEGKSETYCGIETAPGYGEVTSKLPATDTRAMNAATKKVFKCPHCSFWASTASRFHVHIVGHLNKKPFECSLCSYRSNWRWDITKHIRLKTIRDPSHKNAGVLMNDETGRRNYTKYNKYITLMRITDTNAKDSTAYSKSAPENTVADLLAACSTYNIDLTAFANVPGYKLLLGPKQLGEDVLPPASVNSDSKSYAAYLLKCKSCEYRTASNEELLRHATTEHAAPAAFTHLDDVIETEPSGDTTTTTTTGDGSAAQLRNCTTVSSVPGVTPLVPSASAMLLSDNFLSKGAANTSSECSSTNGTLLTATTSATAFTMTTTTTGGGMGDRTNATETLVPGEGEGGSQRLAGPAWRHNAPYRCGHCQQVSNWKHVIQRHCRLKHNGHVLIEHISSEKDDPSDGEGPTTQRSTKPTQPYSVYVVDDGPHLISASHPIERLHRQSIESLVATPNTHLPPPPPPPPLAPFNCDELGYPIGNTLEPIVEILDKDPSEGIEGNSSTVLISSGTVAPTVPGGQLDCVSCQFHAETIEQLTEHLEAHIGNGQRESLLDPVPTVLFYCPSCPARFFDRCHAREHEERHGTIGEGAPVCPICTYVIPSGEDPSRHLEVHSAAYNKNTENLQIFLAESSDYPKPRLTMLESVDKRTVVWCVERTPDESAAVITKHVPSPDDQSAASPKRSKRSKQHEPHRRRSVDTASIGTDQPPLRSIFLCEYCDSAFDGEPELDAHVRSHFSAILAAQNVAYYTSLNGALRDRGERTLELVITGAQSTLPLHYVYDNTRSKEWATFSKTESVLLQL